MTTIDLVLGMATYLASHFVLLPFKPAIERHAVRTANRLCDRIFKG